MNTDEAQKCLLVAQGLLKQAGGDGDVASKTAALARAAKFVEKARRLDLHGAGDLADELLGKIATMKRSLGSDGASSQQTTHNTEGSSGSRDATGGRQQGQGQRRASSDGQQKGSRDSAENGKTPQQAKQPQVKGTPEQETLMRRIQGFESYYDILGIQKDADDGAIKKAYRKLALKLHPDKCKAEKAEEVFKSVSKAFACLSDADKRAAYDRYGTEEPNSLRNTQQGGGGVYRRRAGNNTYYTEQEVDPAQIFNMFFGGGFGGPGVRFTTGGGGGGFHNQQFARQQAERAARANARQHTSQSDPDPAELARGLFQMLPLLFVFLLYFLSPGVEERYALSRTPSFRHEMRTSSLYQPFYVKDMGAFDEAYPGGTRLRQRFETTIEQSHVNAMEHNCLYERQQQQRLFRYGNKAERERANEMTLNSCVKLTNVRKKQNQAHGNGHQRGYQT